MGTFKLKENLPYTTRQEIDRISAIASTKRLQSEADFLTALAPYLVNEVIVKDDNDLITSASGNDIPTGDTGFKKGAIFIKKNATDSGLYTNDGNEVSAVWTRVDTDSFESVTDSEDAPVNAVASKATLTSDTTNPDNADTLTVNEREYTFVTALTADPVIDEILIGDDTDATLLNIKKALNHEAGEGINYSTGTVVNADLSSGAVAQNAIVLSALIKGVVGDDIEISVGSDHLSLGEGVTALEDGVDGTPGTKGDKVFTSTYEYTCIADNTIADANWRRVSLGSAY